MHLSTETRFFLLCPDPDLAAPTDTGHSMPPCSIPNNTQTGHSTLPHATRHPTKKLLFHMGVKILSCHRGRCRYLCSVISEYLLFVSTTLKLILTKSAYFYDEFVQRKYVVGSRWWAENMSVNSLVGCFSEHAPYPSWYQCCVVVLVQWFYSCVLA